MIHIFRDNTVIIHIYFVVYEIALLCCIEVYTLNFYTLLFLDTWGICPIGIVNSLEWFMLFFKNTDYH